MRDATLALVAAAVVSLALVQNASAIQITGEVVMRGSLNLNSTDLATATAVTAFEPAQVVFATGTFFGTAGRMVTFTPFSWDPQNTPVIPLCSLTSEGWTYTFDLNTITSVDVDQNAPYVSLAGSGMVKITGLGSPYDATGGDWTLTISAMAGPEFGFGFVSAPTVVRQVPDSGMTVALLGLALMGVEGIRRKLADALT